ncbi:thioredoxin family protein [Bacteroidota bacterium]
MKHFIVVSLLLFILSGMYAQETVKWYSLTEAIELNSIEPRKIIVDVYTDWCGWCKRMDATTFSNEEIAAYINENFYAVKFNAEMKDSLQLGDKMYYFVDNGRRGYHEVAAILTKGNLSYPTIVYLDEELRHMFFLQDDKKYYSVEAGYKTPEQLEPILKYYNEEQFKQGVVR